MFISTFINIFQIFKKNLYFLYICRVSIYTLVLVWGIKLKKVDLSWPAVFSKSYNPSWIELNFLSSPWIELTQSLHIWSRLDLTQVEYTNSSQLRVDSKLKKINFFQVNSRKNWKNLNFIKWAFFAVFMKWTSNHFMWTNISSRKDILV